MGQRTRAQLVSDGLLKAGKTSLTTQANVWFNAWLRSQYKAWPWPWLFNRVTALALPTATAQLTFGVGNSGVTLEVQRIIDPIWVYDAAYSTRVMARVTSVHGGAMDADDIVNNPAKNIGTPARFKVRADPTVWGKWTLRPTPVPEKSYLLAIDYLAQPADLTTDLQVPTYPNDRTMIQAICVEAWQHMGDERYGEGLEVLGAMVVDDRMKYGEVDGTNDQPLGLNSNLFR